MIDAKTVAQLRAETGAGLMDAKRALEAAGGDLTQAAEALRVKGLARAQSKEARTAAEGLIASYVHAGRIGVLVELSCETDFVARGDDFTSLARELTLQVAASAPEYLKPEEIPDEVLATERRLATEAARSADKPDSVTPKIVEGRLQAFFKERCLLKQPYIKDPTKSVESLVAELSARLGEKIEVTRFVRFELGRR